MALTSRLTVGLTCEQTNPLDLGTASFPLSVTFLDQLASGIGADQADVLFSDERTLASGANEDLDVAGALAGAFGAAAVYAKVKGILFITNAANTTRLTISRPAANGLPIFAAASDSLASLGASALFALWDPSLDGLAAVTAGTADLINIANGSGASATYRIVILGTSA